MRCGACVLDSVFHIYSTVTVLLSLHWMLLLMKGTDWCLSDTGFTDWLPITDSLLCDQQCIDCCVIVYISYPRWCQQGDYGCSAVMRLVGLVWLHASLCRQNRVVVLSSSWYSLWHARYVCAWLLWSQWHDYPWFAWLCDCIGLDSFISIGMQW